MVAVQGPDVAHPSYIQHELGSTFERICSRISHNLFIMCNRLFKILDVNVIKMLYDGLIYPLMAYGILWVQRAKAQTRQNIYTPRKGFKIHNRVKTRGIV
jgi:hypothetical protein